MTKCFFVDLFIRARIYDPFPSGECPPGQWPRTALDWGSDGEAMLEKWLYIENARKAVFSAILTYTVPTQVKMSVNFSYKTGA